MMVLPHGPLFTSDSTSQKFWVKKNLPHFEKVNHLKLFPHQTEARMENGIQKEEKLTTNVVSNCKAFLLKSFNSQENSFSIQKKKHTQKNRFKPPFYYFYGGGECMLKKEEVQSPLKFL